MRQGSVTLCRSFSTDGWVVMWHDTDGNEHGIRPRTYTVGFTLDSLLHGDAADKIREAFTGYFQEMQQEWNDCGHGDLEDTRWKVNVCVPGDPSFDFESQSHGSTDNILAVLTDGLDEAAQCTEEEG